MIDFNQNQSTGKQKKSKPGQWLELHVSLHELKPPVSRVILVPADATFGWLHAVLQVSMGWTNSHMHQFIVNGKCLSEPEADLDPLEEGSVLDENKVRLNELLVGSKMTFFYEYDFGDSWVHQIKAKKFSGKDAVLDDQAVCIDGDGACPPEDCGGLPGYLELLKVLKNKKHPEHRSMQEWLGRPFDPAYFVPEQANRWLAKLKWPRVTEAALRKILMARDGFGG